MNSFIDLTIDFFVDNFPSWQAIAVGGPLGLAWSFACLWAAGRLKQNRIRTGYTRKTFHFLIFGSVAGLQWKLGTPAVCLFGGHVHARCLLRSVARCRQHALRSNGKGKGRAPPNVFHFGSLLYDFGWRAVKQHPIRTVRGRRIPGYRSGRCCRRTGWNNDRTASVSGAVAGIGACNKKLGRLNGSLHHVGYCADACGLYLPAHLAVVS